MNPVALRTCALAAGVLLVAPTCSARDLSLSDAISLALSGNTSLRVTQKDEITAEQALRQAKGESSLSASLSDSLSVSKQSDSDRQSSNGLTVTGALPIYSGGKNEAAIRRSLLALDAAGLTTERAREDLKLSVITAYYDALEAKKTIAVREDTVAKYRDHLDLTSVLYAAGSKARIDVLDMSVQLSNARQDLIKAQNSYEVDLAKLRDYIGIDRNEPLTLTTDFVYAPFSTSLSDAVAYAYTNRKDILADESKLRQREEALTEAKAGYRPSVDFSVSAGQSNAFEPSGGSAQDIRGTVGLSWNIFDSGVTKAKVKSADNDIDVARLTLQKDKEAADLTLREAYYNMREAEERFNSTGDAVKLAEENYYIAREKYRAGEGLLVDITDAQESLATARLNEISARYDYVRYKAAVENAMGMSLTDAERSAADQMAPLLWSVKDGSAEERALAGMATKKTAKAAKQDASKEAKKAESAPVQQVIEPAGRAQARDRKDIVASEDAKSVARTMAGTAGEVTK